MAEHDRTMAAVAGAAVGVGATLLTTARRARAAPAPEGVSPELWDMLTSLIEAVAAQTASIDSLIMTLGGTPTVSVEDPFENTPKFATGQVICTALNRGFHLPPITVPKNKQLVVKALPGNVGDVVIGATQADSQNIIVAYPLVANEGVGLFVRNATAVWVMAPAPPMGALNDGIAFLVEQE